MLVCFADKFGVGIRRSFSAFVEFGTNCLIGGFGFGLVIVVVSLVFGYFVFTDC